MKSIPLLLAVSFCLSFSVAQEAELTGTYSGNGISFSFIKGMKVDVTVAVPKVADVRSSQIIQRSATTVTIRCDYDILSDLPKVRAMVIKEGGNKLLEESLEKFGGASGYSRWILLNDLPEIASILAESDGALVDVYSSRVYKKKPWYSR